MFLTRKKNNTFNSSRPEEALYEELLTSESKGKFVNACVKGKYVFKRLK